MIQLLNNLKVYSRETHTLSLYFEIRGIIHLSITAVCFKWAADEFQLIALDVLCSSDPQGSPTGSTMSLLEVINILMCIHMFSF